MAIQIIQQFTQKKHNFVIEIPKDFKNKPVRVHSDKAGKQTLLYAIEFRVHRVVNRTKFTKYTTIVVQ